MLSRTTTSIAFSLLASACLFAGCVIKEGDPIDDPTTTGNTTQTTSGGGAGAGGTGEGGGGVGGSGGTGGDGGSGGAGGSGACVGVDGTGLDVKSCDNMNITPTSAGGAASSICEADGGTAGSDPPPGYAVCQHGFDVFNAGPAEKLQKCLGMIGVEPANACDPKQVQDCVNAMYEATCAVASITTYCNEIKTACEGAGQTLNAENCAYELKPFNQKTIMAYEDCFNNADPNLTCQQAHDDCYVKQL